MRGVYFYISINGPKWLIDANLEGKCGDLFCFRLCIVMYESSLFKSVKSIVIKVLGRSSFAQNYHGRRN